MEEACHSCHGRCFSWGMWLMRDYTFKCAVALNAAVNLWNITQNTQYNKRNKPFFLRKKEMFVFSLHHRHRCCCWCWRCRRQQHTYTQCVYFNGLCCISFGIVKGDTQLWETNYYIESERGWFHSPLVVGGSSLGKFPHVSHHIPKWINLFGKIPISS